MDFLKRKKQVEFLGSEYRLGLHKPKTYSYTYTCECGEIIQRSRTCLKPKCFTCKNERAKANNRSTSFRNVQNYLKRKLKDFYI